MIHLPTFYIFRDDSKRGISKAAILFFLHERPEKAEISRESVIAVHTIAGFQISFPKSIKAQVICEMASLLGQAGEKLKSASRVMWGAGREMVPKTRVLPVMELGARPALSSWRSPSLPRPLSNQCPWTGCGTY